MSASPVAERPDLRGLALHFDCASGIAGDMTVAALVDAGVPEAVVREALSALPLSGFRVAFERVMRGALTGCKLRVLLDDPHHSDEKTDRGAHGHDDHHHAGDHHHSHDHAADHAHDHGHGDGNHAHRHYAEIRAMLCAAPLLDGVRRRALSIFDRIAAVEAKLHGVSVEEVAFHEVGAVDSIVDIVAAAAALEWLRPVRVTSRRVPLGSGSVRTAHGLLPVPAPATLELLVGAAVESGGVACELTTPTGAAILAATVDEYVDLPPLAVAAVGWGAGDRELPDRPNLLRVILGAPAAAAGDAAGAGRRCVVLEANVDDSSPELLAPLIGDLLAAGARDAWVTSVLMKKGRPGFLVAALADPEAVAAVEAALLAGSSTIGVRRHGVERTVLPRRMVEVATPFGAVAVKVAGTEGSENVAPEHEDCLRLARRHGVPLKRIYAEALAAFYRR